jgi:hypothetical protein
MLLFEGGKSLDINESVANAGVAGAKRFLSHQYVRFHILSNIQKKILSTSKNHLGLELNVPVYCMTTIP